MTDKKIAKIEVKRDLCIGAASCVIAAGTVFELDAENRAIIKLAGGKKDSGPADKTALESPAISDEELLTAAESCPTAAVYLYAEDGSQIYPQP
ncbi:ferredoxin [Patescibacteria group bacterium]|nr:ferredoxin [Patescibacteria group bacterium]MBU1034416.1 ferredoxin [Patescibacteria group bacterium]MBU1907646.1 ferredoxin [Patescibacteria group bacterium]